MWKDGGGSSGWEGASFIFSSKKNDPLGLMNGSERQFSSILRDSVVLAGNDLVYDIDIDFDIDANVDVGI